MSVGALVVPSLAAPRDEPGPGYLPVATEADWSQYWLPLATSAGLDVVRGFQPGVALKPHDLPVAVVELERLHALVSDAALDPSVADRILDRVTTLREMLTALGDDDVEEVFIG